MLIERIKHATENVQQNLKASRLIEKLKNNWEDLAFTAAFGYTARATARYLLVVGGINGLPLAIAGGAGAGAFLSVMGELRRQEVSRHSLAINRRQLVASALRGAAKGAVGSFIGWEISDLVMTHILSPNHPGISLKESGENLSNNQAETGGNTPLGSDNHMQAQPGETPEIPSSEAEVTQPETPLSQEASEPQTIPTEPEPPKPKLLPPTAPPAVSQYCPAVASLPQTHTLADGSTVWETSASYLKEAGITPTGDQIGTVARQVAQSSDIEVSAWEISGGHLATQLPVGYELDFSQAKDTIAQFVCQTTPSEQTPSTLSDIRPLASGSSVWSETASYLRSAGITPTNEEINEYAKIVARDSDVRVDAWGIQGSHPASNLPPGYKLAFSGIKKLIRKKIGLNSLLDEDELYE